MAALKLLPHYNLRSSFIISIYSIPKLYAHKQYPQLFDENVKAVLRKFGISPGEEPLLQPVINDEKLRKEWALIGLEIDSVGYELRHLIMDKLFAMFSGLILGTFKEYFRGLKNELNTFLEGRLKVLKEAMTRIRGKLKEVENGLYVRSRDYHFHDRDCKRIDRLKLASGGNIMLMEYRRGDWHETSINYMEFVSFLAPAMFLGLAWLRPGEDPPLVFFKWW